MGAVTVLAGWLARRQETTLAALLVHLPVISLGAFWAASASGRQTMQATVTQTLLVVPVWIAWTATVLALLRYTSLPGWGCLLLGMTVWLLAASLAFLLLAK